MFSAGLVSSFAGELKGASSIAELMRIGKELAAENPPQDKFETTAAYNARMAKADLAQQAKVYSYVFLESEVRAEYDADKQIISWTSPYWSGGDFDLAKHSQIIGHYIGENSFGVKARVTKVLRTDVYISSNVIGPASDGSNFDAESFSKFSAHISPEVAKRIWGKVAFVFYFSFTDPFYQEERPNSWGSATIDDPEDVYHASRGIDVKLVRIEAVNQQSGEVLGSVDPYGYLPEWKRQVAHQNNCPYDQKCPKPVIWLKVAAK
jgi:hypothetical protein